MTFWERTPHTKVGWGASAKTLRSAALCGLFTEPQSIAYQPGVVALTDSVLNDVLAAHRYWMLASHFNVISSVSLRHPASKVSSPRSDSLCCQSQPPRSLRFMKRLLQTKTLICCLPDLKTNLMLYTEAHLIQSGT